MVALTDFQYRTIIQNLLQHSSPTVTRRYIGVSDEQMEQAIARHVNIISA